MSDPPSDSPDLALSLRLAARIGGRLRLVALALLGIVAVGLWWTGTLAELTHPERVRSLVDAAGPAAPLAFIALLIPLNPVFLAGAPIWISSTLFPLPLAIVYSIVGATLASAGTHALAAYFGTEWARERIPHRLHGFRDRIEDNPVRSVATLRLLLWINPGVDLLTAVSSVPPRAYVFGTVVGIALPTALRVYVGHLGAEAMAGSNAWLWGLLVVAVLALLGLRHFRNSRRRSALDAEPFADPQP
jgi:uncharacterized membrane protein YdjX (TVP38/TMEM64 family)